MIPFVIRSVRNLLQPKSLRRGFRLRVMGLTAIGIYLSWFVMSSSFRRKKILWRRTFIEKQTGRGIRLYHRFFGMGSGVAGCAAHSELSQCIHLCCRWEIGSDAGIRTSACGDLSEQKPRSVLEMAEIPSENTWRVRYISIR